MQGKFTGRSGAASPEKLCVLSQTDDYKCIRAMLSGSAAGYNDEDDMASVRCASYLGSPLEITSSMFTSAIWARYGGSTVVVIPERGERC